jgi:invasion protein IalB
VAYPTHFEDRRNSLVLDVARAGHPPNVGAILGPRSLSAWGRVFACVLFAFSGTRTVQSADLKKEATFGDWAQYCGAAAPQSTSECALIQNVSGDLKVDPRVWVKSSIELTKAQKVILTLRFDKSIQTEAGAGLSIDNQSIGVSSFFECDVQSCKSSLELGSKYSRNELGRALEQGKSLIVDFKTDEDSGYSLPINLVGLREGISVLTAEPTWLLSADAKTYTANSQATAFGTFNASSPKVAFNVEFVRQLDNAEFVDRALAVMRSKDTALDFRSFYGEGCSGSTSPTNGSPSVVASAGLKTVVTFNSDMAVPQDAIDRLKKLNEKSKKCGDKAGYFSVVLDPESLITEPTGRSGGAISYAYDWKVHAYDWGAEKEWHNRVHSELSRAINEAGISRARVSVDLPWAISPVWVPDMAPFLINAR